MSTALLDLPGGASVPVDHHGYLLDWRSWTPDVARAMAAADGIALGDDHWAVLELFRAWYAEYAIEPPMRALVRLAGERLGEGKGTSRYLYRLFPDGPGTQACRYAGLPRPASCI
jgi:tRNA 2-thiouridine synthesizing protein E